MNLSKLKARFKARLAKQKKHYAKWQRFKKAGKKVRARYQLGRFRVHRKAVVKLSGLIAKERKRRATLRASGTGPYAGSESVAREIERFVESRRGECSGSEKRWETYGNPSSDHYAGNSTAYAIDFLLVNDYAMAAELYAYLTGNPASQWGGDYSNFYIVRGGRRFRVQLIAGTHGTGPHLHAGVRRA